MTEKDNILAPEWSPEYAKRLEALYNSLGPRKDIAKQLGLKKPTMLRLYLTGEAKMPFYIARQLCRLSGNSLDWLAYGVEPISTDKSDIDLTALGVALESLVKNATVDDIRRSPEMAARLIIQAHDAVLEAIRKSERERDPLP